MTCHLSYTLLLAWSCTLVEKPKTTEKGLKA
jgi:hypothetical protein